MTQVARRVGNSLVIEQRSAGGSTWWRHGPDGWSYTTDHKANATWLSINAIYVPADVLRAAVKAEATP